MNLMTFFCAFCGKENARRAGDVRRSERNGRAIFCDLECSGKARRKNQSIADKRAAKARYDLEYRLKNQSDLKAKKAAYYQRTKDPEKERISRKNRAHLHAEYCRQPEYKKWKAEYDRRRRAKLGYGEFADCFLLTQQIRAECLKQQSDYEIRLAAGTLSKHLKRRRDYEKTNSTKSEIGALGNLGESPVGSFAAR